MPGERSQVSFTCSSCGDLVSAPLRHVGLRVECPSCRAPLAVPAPGAPGAEAVSSEPAAAGAAPIPLDEADALHARPASDDGQSPPERRASPLWIALALGVAFLLMLLMLLVASPRGDGVDAPHAGGPERPGTDADTAPRGVPGEAAPPSAAAPREPGPAGARAAAEQEDTLPDPPTEDEKAAWKQAVQAVLWKLKEPDSAEFPEVGAQGTSIERRESRYIVNGYVDAKNRLGETVRTEFRSVVERLPGTDAWVTRTVRLTEE